jgi:hypothetical protein
MLELLNRVVAAQECDATEDDSSNDVGDINKIIRLKKGSI